MEIWFIVNLIVLLIWCCVGLYVAVVVTPADTYLWYIGEGTKKAALALDAGKYLMYSTLVLWSSFFFALTVNNIYIGGNYGVMV